MDELKACMETDELIKELRRYGLSNGTALGRHMEIMGIAADRLEQLSRCTQPENKPLTCKGCINYGKYENEREYGYPSPCTVCKRICTDNYAHKPEQEEK